MGFEFALSVERFGFEALIVVRWKSSGIVDRNRRRKFVNLERHGMSDIRLFQSIPVGESTKISDIE